MTARANAALLWACLALVAAVRLAAWFVLAPPIESDGLAYVTMADALVKTGTLTDNFGQHVFYSAGYPLLLAPAFAVLGAGAGTVLAVNLLLAVLSGGLLYALVQRLGGSRGAALAAVLLWAVWLPAVWNAAMPAKENLSTALLLGLLLAALGLAKGPGWLRPALAAGLCWGAGVLTGGSSILAGGAVAVALGAMWLAGRKRAAVQALAVIALGGALVLGPWLVASERMVGEPLLNSNAEFNLYLGNNPAATGTFVSVGETPAGAQWEARRAALGEAGSAHWLGAQARDWIAANPAAAARLAAVKLWLFWQPNVPDATDFAASRAVATVRLLDIGLYLVVVAAALLALVRPAIAGRDRLIVTALVGGFWAVHAAAYVMPRYRDPLAPVLIALALCWLWPLAMKFLPKGPADAA